MYKTIFFFLLLLPLISFSQRINNQISYRDMNSDAYMRLSYDNDYFTGTDKYYTQGINLEVVSNSLRKNPLNFLLLRRDDKYTKYGIAVDHFGFTPTSIRSSEILQGDRPFAGNLSLKSFNVVYDAERNNIYTSSITLGVIGSRAGGEWMQTTIHEAIGDQLPIGWQFQIANDVIINYEVAVEKRLYTYYDSFLFNVSAGANAGTLSNKVHGGFNFRLGKLKPEIINEKTKGLQFYIFCESLVNAIGYDPTMQGGVFNRSSPYTIAAKDIKRLTFQQNFGVVLNFRKIYLEYFQSLLTPEFRGEKMHRWGGIKIGVKL